MRQCVAPALRRSAGEEGGGEAGTAGQKPPLDRKDEQHLAELRGRFALPNGLPAAGVELRLQG